MNDPKLTATVDQLQMEVDSLSAQLGIVFVAIACLVVVIAVVELRHGGRA